MSGQWASQLIAAMDSEIASWRSTSTYVDAVPPPGANAVDDMWIFKGNWSPGSPPVFKARYVARAHRNYELHSLNFSTAFLQGSLHEEIWLRRPPSFTETFPPRTQWSLRRPVYGLREAPHEWHDKLRTTLAGLGFRPSSTDPSLLVRSGPIPFFFLVYVNDLVFATADKGALVEPTPLAADHRLTGPFSDKPFESSGPYAELVGCFMYLMTCTRPDLTFPLSVLSRFVATGRHRPVHWIAAVRVGKYLATTSGMGLVLGGTHPFFLTGRFDSSNTDDVEKQSAKAEIYTGVMARRGQARLDFVASEANTADIFTNALPPGDHHRFRMQLECVVTS
ncbi:unnamed protein product [Closterium sp. NIES-53]